MASIAAGIVLFRLVDLYWFTAPAFHDGVFAVHWLDFVVPLTIGALWLAVFSHFHAQRPTESVPLASRQEGGCE
jgi:hypothetical protein